MACLCAGLVNALLSQREKTKTLPNPLGYPEWTLNKSLLEMFRQDYQERKG